MSRSSPRISHLPAVAIAVAALVLGACSCGPGGGDPDASACPINGAPTLEVGVPDSITFLDFETLAPGGDIPLSSNGQTFLAVQLAVQATNLDRFVNIAMTVTYQPPAGAARVAVKDGLDTERLFCFADDTGSEKLHLIPIVVSSEDLGDDVEIQGQSVDVMVTITDAASREVSAQASGVLRRL